MKDYSALQFPLFRKKPDAHLKQYLVAIRRQGQNCVPPFATPYCGLGPHDQHGGGIPKPGADQ
jgi:hypothetical protein